jgi:hypothetical protein
MKIVSLDRIGRRLKLTVDDIPHFASLSYRHPNGFDKIVLDYQGLDQPSLRLHVWWGDSIGDCNNDIHDHPWSFDSQVVCGRLVQEIWTPATGGKTDRVTFQVARIQLKQYPLQCAETDGGFVAARRRKCEHVEAGQNYSLSGREFHRVYSLEKCVTATLVNQNPVYRWFSTAWRAKNRLSTPLRGKSMSSAEYRLVLDRLMDRSARADLSIGRRKSVPRTQDVGFCERQIPRGQERE